MMRFDTDTTGLRSLHLFVDSLINGDYFAPNYSLIEQEALSRNIPLEEIEWLEPITNNGIPSSELRQGHATTIVNGIQANPDYWKANLIQDGEHGKVRINWGVIPPYLTALGDSENVAVQHSTLLMNAILLSNEEDPLSNSLMRAIAVSGMNLERWKKIQEIPELSNMDLIHAYSKLGWAEDLDYWSPDDQQIEKITKLIKLNVTPLEALTWTLAVWLYDTQQTSLTDIVDLIKCNIHPSKYVYYQFHNVTDTKTIIKLATNGIDAELGSALA